MKTNLVIVLGILIFLSSCGGYSSVNFNPVQVNNVEISSQRKFEISAADSDNINLIYPNWRSKGNDHIIPVKDYFFTKLLSTVPENIGITSMKVTKFQSKCDGRGFFGPKLWCISSCEINYTINKKDKIIKAYSESEVGPVFAVGDISPPFTWGSDMEDVVHNQAKKAMYALVVNIKSKIEEQLLIDLHRQTLIQ